MRLSKLYSLSLAAMLLTTPTFTTWAQPHNALTSNDSAFLISPRFSYIEDAAIKIDPSSNGINYSVRVSGIDEVTSISGTLTIYKGNSKIYSKTLSTNKSELRESDTIPSKGSGSYTITFSGTVYTKTGSESIDMDMEDSY